jgi:hypothetical protein
MDHAKPTKVQVRQFMHDRQVLRRPLPDIKELRRQIGWDLAEMARKQQTGR